MRLSLNKTLKIWVPIGILVVLIALWGVQSNLGTTTYQQSSDQEQAKSDDKEKIEIVIEPGDTFATIMESADVPYEETEAILVSAKDVYDLTKLHAGKLIHLFFAEEALAAVDYDLNDEMKIVVEKNESGFEAREEPIVYDIKQTTAEATITSSLFANGAEVGLSDTTLLALADIFAWDIDFSTDIREGDSFKIVYEKRFLDGEEAGQGNILAARFENQEVEYQAFYYRDTSGKEGYYTSDGASLSRQFLKSPINFGYVSSGFSYSRVNPVTKQVTPHRAIDYAAPQGVPVIATADGTVTFAGRNGAYGIYVEVAHEGGYVTEYAHLSRIKDGVEKGATITQDDVVGYVGSTGISTGPHLQYALRKDGTPINPLTADLPPGKPLDASEREQFLTSIVEWRQQIRK